MAKVVIIQRTLKFYRLQFYNLLKQKLEENGIELILLYGEDDNIKFNDAELDWGLKIKNYKINLFGKTLYYQSLIKYIRNADLIIVEQASKLLINYYFWLLNLFKIKRLAFWGHGIDFQNSNHKSFSVYIKKKMTKKVHWFFAYTDLSKRVLESTGYPAKRITTVYNTIDVESIIEEKKKWHEKNLIQIKEQLGIKSDNICLFIGGMYKEKRLQFLINSLLIIRNVIPDFHFIFIGDGPDKNIVLNVSANHKWIHYLGSKNDIEKIPYFLIAKLLLNPGLVGLVIIDSFTIGVPLITTNCKLHSPEIDYLEKCKNGIMTENNIAAYSSAIIDLLTNEEKRLKLVEVCTQSAKKYTMENMVNNFYNGILTSIKYI
jgi:glycosyltransferase involved in cell wall biosynthesis